MDQTPDASITNEYREKVYKELAEVMLHGLENGQITVKDSKELSQFVLDNSNRLGTYGELSSFLQELVNKWPVFKAILLQLQDDFKNDSFKNEKINEIREDISQIKNQ